MTNEIVWNVGSDCKAAMMIPKKIHRIRIIPNQPCVIYILVLEDYLSIKLELTIEIPIFCVIVWLPKC